MPALAALLIVAGFQGLRIEAAETIWQTSRVSAAVMGLTFLATLFIPLQYAVLIGVVLSIVLHVVRQSNKVVITQWVLVPGGLPEEQPAPKELPSQQLTMLQIYGSLFFAAAKNLEDDAARRGQHRSCRRGARVARRGGDRQHLRRRLAALCRGTPGPQQQADVGGRRRGRARPARQDRAARRSSAKRMSFSPSRSWARR